MFNKNRDNKQIYPVFTTSFLYVIKWSQLGLFSDCVVKEVGTREEKNAWNEMSSDQQNHSKGEIVEPLAKMFNLNFIFTYLVAKY